MSQHINLTTNNNENNTFPQQQQKIMKIIHSQTLKWIKVGVEIMSLLYD